MNLAKHIEFCLFDSNKVFALLDQYPENEWFRPKHAEHHDSLGLLNVNLIIAKRIVPVFQNGKVIGAHAEYFYNRNMEFKT